jgi:hypothetical protein
MRFQAALDPPAETKRQFFTLVIWFAFLASAVVGAAFLGPHASREFDSSTQNSDEEATPMELRRSHVARLKVALLVGLVAPGLATLALRRRHRRHGAHARGITIELTDTELRLWGRGYGTRVATSAAEIDERLVDVYAGRLGAWRQVRMRIRCKARELELAAPVIRGELPFGLRLEGGEGDCVEIERGDYDALKRELEHRLQGTPGSGDRRRSEGR